MTPNKVPLKWRIALTPLAVLLLPFFLALGCIKGLFEWQLGLMEFWRGE